MTEQQRGFISDIFGSGQHLLSLINDILDLSKVEAGKMMLDLESVLVSSLLANSLSIVRERAASRRIILAMEVDEKLGMVEADTRKVKQIVYNLLSNAVKFTVEGGHVNLRASRVGRAQVGQLEGTWASRTFPLPENEFTTFLEISVSDDGIGISPTDLDQLFRPFSQIDSGLARKFEGTGLGLAMVKILADLHGGTVRVKSAVGVGSCFTAWIPLRAADKDSGKPAKVPIVADQKTNAEARTALVVEDDLKSADLIRVQLEAEGFEVLHAVSAEAALALALQQPLSLITLDILLPHMDGWELLTRIKQMPGLRTIPVVILSVVAEESKGFALGAAAIMLKPVSRQDLHESLLDVGLLPLTQGPTLKILLVDDDLKAADLMAHWILDLASSVLRASSGQEAIEISRLERPDLIILDLMMPGVSGFDVVEALRKSPDTARIPIVAMTAKQITTAERTQLNGFVTSIVEKTGSSRESFMAEVRRAMSFAQREAAGG